MPRNDKTGLHSPDQTPLERALRFQRPLTLQEQIQVAIATHASKMAVLGGHESFEEADDFDVGEDFDPQSPWEYTEDQERQVRAQMQEIQENARSKRQADPGPAVNDGEPDDEPPRRSRRRDREPSQEDEPSSPPRKVVRKVRQRDADSDGLEGD